MASDGDEPKKDDAAVAGQHDTLKYSLLGPSLTKSGQDNVDQRKVSPTITTPMST